MVGAFRGGGNVSYRPDYRWDYLQVGTVQAGPGRGACASICVGNPNLRVDEWARARLGQWQRQRQQ